MKKFIFPAALAMAMGCAAQVNSPAVGGYLDRGVLMYQDANYIGCIDQLNHLKSQSPTPSELEEADYYIAMSSAHLGRSDAPQMLKHFIWRYPTSPRCNAARLAIGDLLLDGGEYGEAYDVYAKVNPDALDGELLARLNYNKAYCLLKRCDYDAALPLYKSLAGNADYGNDARFYEGYIAYAKGDYRSAADIFRGVDTDKAPANMADYYLSQIYYKNGDYDKAITTAKRLLSKKGIDDAYTAEACRIAGESLYHQGDDAEAIPLLRNYIESVDEPLASARYILGVADYRTGDYDAAIANLTPVAQLDDAMGQSANLFIGEAFMQQRNYSSAMIAFEKALRLNFDADVRETAFYNYAVAKTQGGKIPFGSSVSTFEEFLRAFPSSRYAPKIREYIVTGYMTDDNYPAALASIEAIPDPSSNIMKAKQQVLYTLGSRELSAGNTASAINRLEQARKIRGYNPQIGAETDLWLGDAYYAAGRYDDAAKSYESYLNTSSADSDNRNLAVYNLAYARFSAKNYDEAMKEFNRFISDAGKSPATMVADAYNRVGDCLYYASDFRKAADAYSLAFKASPSTGDYALYQEALMKGLTRDYKAKIEGMRDMIQKFPKSALVPQALIETGEGYEQLSQTDKAIETYSLIIARYPSSQQGRQASLLLALAYLNEGNRAEAVNSYERLIKSAPTSREALQAMDNLKMLMAEDGRIAEYSKFIAGIPGAKQIEPSELDDLTFAAAERDYLSNGSLTRITEYLRDYPEGASRPTALAYAIAASRQAGRSGDVIKYASQLIENYPDNPAVADALLAKGESELAENRAQAALESFTRLSQTASSPYLINESRIGIIRAASLLGHHDAVIEQADALTASSTISDAQRSEARFNRAKSRSAKGEYEAAAKEWSELAVNLDDLYGTMSQFSLAQQQFDLGKLKDARTNADRLINSDSPYDYWYARAIILLSDINRQEGNDYEADIYLTNLKEKYPGTETDIFEMIDSRLKK